MNSASETLLEIEDLSLRVGERTLFEQLCLRISPGERVTVQGPSGCGKSSLLRAVLGFWPPTEGTVRVGGEVLDDHSVWHLRLRMAWVPQEADLGPGTVLEALDRPLAYHANRRIQRDEAQLRSWMGDLALSREILDQPTDRLSGGEKQRVALLAALQLQRPLLLLDEPVSALDGDNRARVAKLLGQQKDQSILAVSHDREGLGLDERFLHLGELG
ncbi:MAG: ABC transporter ATP-binding protein [Verrucomicrobia bacterium]|nr:ABC transporter ATP-binding protein [Verrucomicrobiota bacterium]